MILNSGSTSREPGFGTGPKKGNGSTGAGWGTERKLPMQDKIDMRQFLHAAAKANYPVLVIEGESSIQEAIKTEIESFGYPVQATKNLSDALNSIGTQKPAAITIDADTISGYDANEGNYPIGQLKNAITKIKAAAPEAKILCMAITFDSTIETKIKEAGADAVMDKSDFIPNMEKLIDDLMPVGFKAAEKKAMPEPGIGVAPEPQQKKEVKTARILVVDDEYLVRGMLVDHLCAEGYVNVVTAEDGWKGLEEYKKALGAGTPSELILSDRTMPNMVGADMIKEIKKLNPDAKVIFLTGYSGDEQLDPLRAVKPQAILEKPVKGDNLVAFVSDVLAGNDVSTRPGNLLVPAGNGITQSLQ